MIMKETMLYVIILIIYCSLFYFLGKYSNKCKLSNSDVFSQMKVMVTDVEGQKKSNFVSVYD